MPCGAIRPAVLALLIMGCWGGGGPPPTITPVPTTVRLRPLSLVLERRQTRLLDATVLDQMRDTMDIVPQYSSSDTTIAVISPGGLVTALDAGMVRITVAHDTLKVVGILTVLEPFSLQLSGVVRSVGLNEVTNRYECHYTLTVEASGGAPPDDMGTWAPSEIEFIDALGERSTIEVSEVEMVDRFESQVIRSGTSKTTEQRVAEHLTPDFSLIFRIRFMVGEHLMSQSLRLNCPE